MAINKRKILDSAQKHLQKGALEKALKDYETLLKADPKDANFRLKIGDIQLKRGKTDEAIAAYVKVAESFMKNGFDAKAVALYKQITKIDEKRVDVFVPLAELYDRMGLQSDALKVLQQAADVHYREGNKDEALDLLRRMAALDPSNTANRIKVADLLRQGERNDEAVAEYEAVAEELERQGAEEDRIRILARILEIDPERLDLMASVGRSRIDTGNYEAAEKTARMMIDRSTEDPDGWLLLGEACDGLGRDDVKVDAYRRAAEIFRERGEEDRARDLTQRFVTPAELETSKPMPEVEDDLLGSSVDDLGGQNPEESDPGFDPNAMSIGSPIDDLAEAPAPEPVAPEAPLPPLPRASVEAAPESPAASEGDPEQLLAEASVYLRYGKHDRAIESLRAIVAQAPSHGLACMKLGDALKAVGQGDEAIGAYEQAAHAARASGDMAIYDVASEALAELAPERAAALENGSASEPEPEPTPAPDAAAPEAVEVELSDPALDESDLSGEVEQDLAPDLDLELEASIDVDVDVDADVDLDDGLDEPVGDTATPTSEAIQPDLELDGIEIEEEADELEVYVDAGLDEVELELDDEIVEPEPASTPEPVAAPETLTLDAPPSLEEPAPDAPHVDVEIDFGLDLAEPDDDSDDLDVSDPGLEEPETESAAVDLSPLGDELETSAPELQIESPSAGSMTTPAQVAEDLEEADFFFQQGMLDEARGVYDRILAAAPSHPQALLRIGEIEAATPAEAEAPDEIAVEVASDPSADAIGDGLYEDDGGDAASFDLSPDDEADPDDEPTGRLAPEAVPEAPEIEFGSEDDEPGPIRSDVEVAVEPASDESWEAPVDEELGGLEIDLSPSDDAESVADDAEMVADDAAVRVAPADPAAMEEDADVLVAESASPVADDAEPEAVEIADEAEPASEASVELPAETDESDVATLAPLVEDDVDGDAEAEAPVSATPIAEADITAPVVDVVPPDEEQEVAEESTAPVEQAGTDVVEEPMPVVAAPATDDDAFDLAAQLSDVFDLEEPTSASTSATGGTEDEGFEQVFAAFKQGVEGALDESDFEAHYDLGIAYREMGLVEDAISEFRAAMDAPDRKLACLHMMGLCALDLERTADAVAHLEQALALPDVPSDQQMAIRFDLGRAYAADGDLVRARSAFEAVQEQDASFQDVGEQLAGLDALTPEEAPVAADEESDEAFENFDDLMSGEAEADAEEVAPEPEYESFDEFMSDEDSALADESSDDDADEAEPVDAADLEPEASEPEAAFVGAGDESEAVTALADGESPVEDAEALDAESADAEALSAESDPADAEAEEVVSEASDDAVATPAEPDDEPPKRGRRKKKISFV